MNLVSLSKTAWYKQQTAGWMYESYRAPLPSQCLQCPRGTGSFRRGWYSHQRGAKRHHSRLTRVRGSRKAHLIQREWKKKCSSYWARKASRQLSLLVISHFPVTGPLCTLTAASLPDCARTDRQTPRPALPQPGRTQVTSRSFHTTHFSRLFWLLLSGAVRFTHNQQAAQDKQESSQQLELVPGSTGPTHDNLRSEHLGSAGLLRVALQRNKSSCDTWS